MNQNYNMTLGKGLLGDLKDGNYEVDELCSDNGLLSDVFRVVASRSLKAYFESCFYSLEPLPDGFKWDICTEGQWDCGVIGHYIQSCDWERQAIKTTPAPCLHDDTGTSAAAVGIMVGLSVAGILLGSAITIAVCLVWPNIHRWADTKIRGSSSKFRKPEHPIVQLRNSGTNSGLYIDIDDRTQRERIPLPEHPPGAPPTSVQDDTGEYSAPYYEPLARGDNSQQSHKYGLIRGQPATSSSRDTNAAENPDTSNMNDASNNEPSYFVLERTT